MAVLGNIDIVANNTIFDHRASIDVNVIPNCGRPKNHCPGVNNAVFANFYQFRTFQNLATFINSRADNFQFKGQIIRKPVFKTVTALK